MMPSETACAVASTVRLICSSAWNVSCCLRSAASKSGNCCFSVGKVRLHLRAVGGVEAARARPCPARARPHRSACRRAPARSPARRSRPARPSRRADGARGSRLRPCVAIWRSGLGCGSCHASIARASCCAIRSGRHRRRCRCRRPWRRTWRIRRSGTTARRRAPCRRRTGLRRHAGEHLAEHRVEEHRLEVLRGAARLRVRRRGERFGACGASRRAPVSSSRRRVRASVEAIESAAITSPRCRPGSRRRP